jgi:hypothetical protein
MIEFCGAKGYTESNPLLQRNFSRNPNWKSKGVSKSVFVVFRRFDLLSPIDSFVIQLNLVPEGRIYGTTTLNTLY